ncbi:MAG TPA: ABC transporter substrate-binding protein [Thermoanaerobaculia bacterium]|nr:ABC transporter substrate-binding protein [Thermoanaerobaculia bacterium]
MAGTKTLRVGVLTPVNTLNPREAQDFVSQTAVTQIYEPPFAQPAAGRPPEPVLFQERLRQDGPTEHSAAVRSDVRFSDGTPLTARHVADSLARVANLREHMEVEARGDRVIFRLDRPNARLDLALAQRYCCVTLESRGTLFGTGPYMVAPGATPDRTRLVRNPHARRPAAIDEIVIQLYPPDAQGRPEALLGALEAGEVDFTNVLSREDIMRLKNVRRLTEPGSSTAILYMNTERPGLDDARVRRAIALSIDRLEIAKLFYATATAFAATNLLPPMLGRGNDGLIFDAGKARALLAAPGVRKPERLSLLLIFGPRPYLPNPRKVGELIAAQIDKLGIAADVVPTATPQEYRAKVQRGDYDLVLAGWIADTLDPVDFLEATLGSDSIPSPDRKIVVGANLSRWRNRETDDTLASLRQEPRDDVRSTLLKRTADEVPLLPLLYGPTIYAHSWNVKNFTAAPLGIPSFWELDLG